MDESEKYAERIEALAKNQEMADTLFMLFSGFLNAGFSEMQGMHLISTIIQAVIINAGNSKK